MLRDYLEVREDELVRRDVDPSNAPWLFLYFVDDGQAIEWPEKVWYRMKTQVEDTTGVKFAFKTLRPTFCQKAVDDGTDLSLPHGAEVAISEVSRLMGHKSSGTTERYYGRIRKETAFARAAQAWKPLATEQSIRGD